MIRKVLKTEDEVKEFFTDFGKSFSFDTETTSLKYTELEIEGISFCDGKKACYIDLIDNVDKYLILKFLKTIFEQASTVVAHNIVYDMKVLHKYGISLEDNKLYDTMIADHLINENRQHGLKHLSEKLLGKEVTKYEEAEKAGHQSDIFYEYAINDAVWTWELCMYQQPIMKRENLVLLFRDIEMPFQLVLLDMEINGMEIDVDKVKQIECELKQAIEDFSAQMHEILGERMTMQQDLTGNIIMEPALNFNSGAVLQDILFNRLKLKVVETTPSGKPSTGRITIDTYKKDVPFVNLLNKYKIAQKLHSSYFSDDGQIMRNIDKDNKVRPSFRDTGTKTGRLSCSEPNLQQLPKANEDFPVPSRSAFIAGEGRKMIVSDFGSQEICVAAQISKDPTLISALNKGHDVHLAVARSTFNLDIPEECLSKKHPEYNKYKTKFKKERTNAKVVTFGTLYGKGTFGFSKDFGIPEEEAQEMIDKFFEGMPKVKDAIDAAHKSIDDNGYVEYMSGRKRHFVKVTREEWTGYLKKNYRQAFNACIQGFSADMMRMAMISIRKEVKKHPEWDFKIVATIHDEICGTVKEEYAEVAAKTVKEAMESCVDFVVPIVADTEVVDNYNEAK